MVITEFIDRETACVIMSLNSASFPFFWILVVLFIWYVNNWRVLFFVSSVLSFICVIISQKYFLESPRWLKSKNKFMETLAVF